MKNTKRALKKKVKVVCFGGGSALPRLMAELKKYLFQITAISSMADDGGSSGQLRRDFNVLPPGDIARQVLALSSAPKWKKELFQFRFGQEEFPDVGHKGHRLANAFIAGLEYILKDYQKVLKIVGNFMELGIHQALPATIDKVWLRAELENGEIIEGENEIDVPKKHNPNLKIKKLFLKPKAKIFPQTKKAILKANLMIIGPGDLYSSLLPCFLPEGMKEAIKKSKAKKVFICNLMTKSGETNNFSVLDFVKEVEKYIKCPLNFVIYNNFILEKKRVEKYQKEHPEMLDLVKINKELAKEKFISKNLLLKEGPIEHDFQRVAKIIVNLL